MSAGYWGDETLTRSKFIQLDSDQMPVYLTGDLGRLEPDGCLIHLGRIDFQVKIRGYRVELAEVDHVLAAAPGVADCAAWVVKNQLGEDQLVGYVVLKNPGHVRPARGGEVHGISPAGLHGAQTVRDPGILSDPAHGQGRSQGIAKSVCTDRVGGGTEIRDPRVPGTENREPVSGTAANRTH